MFSVLNMGLSLNKSRIVVIIIFIYCDLKALLAENYRIFVFYSLKIYINQNCNNSIARAFNSFKEDLDI